MKITEIIYNPTTPIKNFVFNFPLGYTNENQIKVYIDNVETFDFKIVDKTFVNLNQPVKDVEVKIKREVDLLQSIINFTSGGTNTREKFELLEKNLMYAAQQMVDTISSIKTDNRLISDFDMNGYGIYNLANPVEPHEVSNKLYLDQKVNELEDEIVVKENLINQEILDITTDYGIQINQIENNITQAITDVSIDIDNAVVAVEAYYNGFDGYKIGRQFYTTETNLDPLKYCIRDVERTYAVVDYQEFDNITNGSYSDGVTITIPVVDVSGTFDGLTQLVMVMK